MKGNKILAVIALIALTGFLWMACDSSTDPEGGGGGGGGTTNVTGNGVGGGRNPGAATTPAKDKPIGGALTITRAPATGEVISDITVTGTQFTATIEEWKAGSTTVVVVEDETTFDDGVIYTLIIQLTPKTGFTLAGVAENAFTYAGATSVTNIANSGRVTIVFPVTVVPTPIADASVALTGLPATGGDPADTLVVATEEYTGTITAWEPDPADVEDGRWAGVFKPGVAYKATIQLIAKSGFTFAGILANKIEVTDVDGEESGIGTIETQNTAGNSVITWEFPATEDAVILAATLTAVDGKVIAPAAGNTPVTAGDIVESEEFTVSSITWSTSPVTFAAGVTYTATITLAPGTGYKWPATIAAGMFTVTGATTSASALSGANVVITCTFPETPTLYKVVFNMNGGKYIKDGLADDSLSAFDTTPVALIPAPAPVTVPAGLTALLSTFNKSGGIFLGWSLDSSAAAATPSLFPYTIDAADDTDTDYSIVAYAIWSTGVSTIALKLDYNYETSLGTSKPAVTVANIKGEEAFTYVPPLATAVEALAAEEDYLFEDGEPYWTFAGWYSDTDFEVPFATSIFTTADSDVTLLAKWEKTVSIVNPATGSSDEPKDFTYFKGQLLSIEDDIEELATWTEPTDTPSGTWTLNGLMEDEDGVAADFEDTDPLDKPYDTLYLFWEDVV